MSTIVEIVESRALAGNPLGDATARRIAVWLPPSYASTPERRYPVIYWLTGFAGTGEQMFSGTPWQPGLGDRLDRLAATGAMGEVIPAIDARFRTNAARQARAIGGKSSGGFGALVLAMRHPDLFAAVASHAGDMSFELSALPDLPVAARTLRRHGGVGEFLRQFEAKEKKDGADFTTMMVLAMAGAYSPDPKREHGIALPFDLDTGEIDWTVWQRWKAWDPIELIATHAEALRRMALIFIDAGTRDEHNLDLGARIFVRRLQTLGIACEHQEFDDGHRGTAYRYDVSLPRLAAAIGAPPRS